MRYLFIVLVFFVLIVYATPTYAIITFQRKYGGALDDGGHSVAQTLDMGYIVAGSTKSFGAGSKDVYLIKTDSLGDTIWTRTYGGTDADDGSSVAQTTDGGYIIAGHTESYGAGSADVYLIKTDSFGDTLWTRTYGGTYADFGSSVAQTTDGGYIIAGHTESYGAGSADVYLIKTDSFGDSLWTRTYGDTGADYGNSVFQTSDGNYVIVGSGGNSGVYLIKTDTLGDTIWTKTYHGGGYCFSAAQTYDRGYIITGAIGGAWYPDALLIKTDSLGDSLWAKTYGGYYGHFGYSVAQTSDKGYIMAGYVYSPGLIYVEIIKTDSIGNVDWIKEYGPEGENEAFSVNQTFDGGYIVAGYTHPYGDDGTDVYLIKTDGFGNVGIKKAEERIESGGTEKELIIYPNPFSTSTTIHLTHPSIGHPDGIADAFHGTSRAEGTELNIYDVSGRLVKNLALGTGHSALGTSVKWDGKNSEGRRVKSGIYFLKLIVSGEKSKDEEVKKVIKIE
jgi:hypothetical protein